MAKSTPHSKMSQAEDYSRAVVAAVLRLRGWRTGTAPRNVRDDAFNMLARRGRLFTFCFRHNTPPFEAAQAIQDAEWNGEND